MTPTAFYLLTCAGFGLLIGGFSGLFLGFRLGYTEGAEETIRQCQKILDETKHLVDDTTPDELRKAGAV